MKRSDPRSEGLFSVFLLTCAMVHVASALSLGQQLCDIYYPEDSGWFGSSLSLDDVAKDTSFAALWGPLHYSKAYFVEKPLVAVLGACS